MFKLQNMRDHRHLKWPVRIFFALVIISFVFFYGWNQSGRNKGGNERDFAKLRSGDLNPFARWQYITNNELAQSMDEAKREKLRQLPSQWAQMLQNQMNLERLVSTEDISRTAANDILIERAAANMNVHIPLQKVIDSLNESPDMTNAQLETIAAQRRMTPAQLLEQARRDEEISRVRQIKSLLAHASLFELWQEYSLDNEKMTLEMTAYPIASYESKVTVKDQDLEKYLADHKDQFHIPLQRRYAYLKVDKADLKTQLKPTELQLQAYYEKNQSQYLQKKGTKVEELFSPLTQTKSTSGTMGLIHAMESVRAEAAKEADWNALSQRLNKKDPTRPVMRMETWIEDNANPGRSPKYIERMKTMAKDQVSSPILESNGVYMFRVTDRRGEGVPPLKEIRGRVESDYLDKKVNEEFQAKATQLKDTIQQLKDKSQSATPLRLVAQKLKLKDALTTKVKAADFVLPGVGSFSEDKEYLSGLKVNELSEVLQTPETAAVLQVVEENGDYDPKLAEVRKDVDLAYRKEHAVELARAEAEQSLNIVKGGADFKTALAKAPKPPFTTEPFTRRSPVQSLEAPLINFLKQTLKVGSGSIGMSAYGYDEKKPLGYAVWQVKKLEPPTQAEFAKERQRFEQDYLQGQRETVVREWLADARHQSDYQFIVDEKDKKK